MTPKLYQLMKGAKLTEAGAPAQSPSDAAAEGATNGADATGENAQSPFASLFGAIPGAEMFGGVFEPITSFFGELGTALISSMTGGPESPTATHDHDEPADKTTGTNPPQTKDGKPTVTKPKGVAKPLDLSGIVSEGPLSGDAVPHLLERGEGVLNRNAVSAIGGPAMIDDLNRNIAPRFTGITSPTSGLMAQVTQQSADDDARPDVKVIRSQAPKKKRPAPTNSSSTAPEADLPSLPSFPPSTVMGTLAFNLPGTTHGLYS